MELPIQENNTLTIFNNLINEGKKIKSNIIDEIAPENKCPTNFLNIQISFSYASRLVDLNWGDILFAIENNYFHYSAAINYVISLINECDNEDSPIFKLACIFPSEIIKQEILDQFVVNFAKNISKVDKNNAKNKIMYVVLNWLFDNKNHFVNIFEIIEFVYADFDYPSIISNLIRYMPNENSNLHQIFSSYEKKILYNWQKYLEDQKLKFGKTKV